MRKVGANDKGLGLRAEFVQQLCDEPKLADVDFLELAPENWLGIGGRKRDQLDQIAAKYPLVAHGLSLSIADMQPINTGFVREICAFLDEYGIATYSEHLSLSRDAKGYLYDLFPTPRYEQNIAYLADRIMQVQDLMGRQLVLENVSYYHNYPDQMPEGEFIARLTEQSGCGLLLDINNVYVNSHNHGGDAMAMVRSLPSASIIYYHIAGHLEQADGLLLDTHGMPVIDDVAALGREVFAFHDMRPVLLERDNNVPTLTDLRAELGDIHRRLNAPLHVAA
ncbi:MAG: DUF692 domain-containing protein [Rhodanobacter sp.]